jgi:hypothetical protein
MKSYKRCWGVGQGTAEVVTLGTTTAAITLWTRIRDRFKRKRYALDGDEMAVLEAEPGQPVDPSVLQALLRKLPEEEFNSWTVYETHVAGDWVPAASRTF